MTQATRAWAAHLLHFWFHELGPAQWFGRDAAVDDALRRRFGRRLAALAGQPTQRFLTDPLTARAAVLLFDQCPRNLHRNDRRAFATDRLARAVALGALVRGWDKGLRLPERQFLAMPLMHSERIADQRRALRVYTALGDASILRFARAHYAMIARFGRFPHRNVVLGRKTTPQEARAVAAGNAW